MGAYGQLFGGHKSRDDRDDKSTGQDYDPGGPLDLDSGVVHLAPPAQEHTQDDEDRTDNDEDASGPDGS